MSHSFVYKPVEVVVTVRPGGWEKNNPKHWNVKILMERVGFWKVVIYNLFAWSEIPLISVDF